MVWGKTWEAIKRFCPELYQVKESGILLPNNQRQHIQKDVLLPYALC